MAKLIIIAAIGKNNELGKEIDFEKEEQNSVWKILENKDKKK